NLRARWRQQDHGTDVARREGRHQPSWPGVPQTSPPPRSRSIIGDMSASRRWRPAVAGVLAMAAGLAAAEIVAGALGRTTTPAVAAGEAFIDVVPGWLKELAISWFGTADKVALGVGMA